MERKKAEVLVIGVINIQEPSGTYALLLGELNGNRQVPVIIGPAEANPITMQLKGVETPRPMTHDLFKSCLRTFNIQVSEVLIYREEEGIFYSYVYLKHNHDVIAIDARTSDAILLALTFHAPIYMYDDILETQCMPYDEDEELDDYSMANESAEAESVEELEMALERAIKDENYELASVLRDKIKKQK